MRCLGLLDRPLLQAVARAQLYTANSQGRVKLLSASMKRCSEALGYMTLHGPSVPGRQFLDRHSNPNPIPNPVQELTVQELT